VRASFKTSWAGTPDALSSEKSALRSIASMALASALAALKSCRAAPAPGMAPRSRSA